MDNAKMYIQEVEGTRNILVNFDEKWYSPNIAPSGCWGDVNLYGDLNGETVADIVEKLRIQNNNSIIDDVDFENGDFGEPIEQYEKKTIHEIEEMENNEIDFNSGDVRPKSWGLTNFTLIGDIEVNMMSKEKKSILSELNKIKSEHTQKQNSPTVKKEQSIEL